MEHLRFPIGRFSFNAEEAHTNLNDWRETLRLFCEKLEFVVSDMNETQLETHYRDGGWTARQLVHHLADSHSQALMRFKWSLTEDKPVIKPYIEDRYAKLADYQLPVDSAMMILKGVHSKWSYLMDHMSENDWNKGYHHPESGKFFTLINASALYAWHCMHHLAHIEICKGIR